MNYQAYAGRRHQFKTTLASLSIFSLNVGMNDGPSVVDREIAFASARSLQDASDANEHTRLLDQWVLGVNGAAATALLTFAAGRLGPDAAGRWWLMLSLGSFAVGTTCGAAAMRAHSWALYEWLYFWQLKAGVEDIGTACGCKLQKQYDDALRAAWWHDTWYRLAILAYLAGCISFGIALILS